ncbi:MAG: CopD family protein, partial [Pseudomonadota bacterium]|nr:CopD family protein [Pseudomonadota bacterium]
MDFVWQISDWVEAFNIISVMFWMAGMYYLPRLFVY